MDGIVKRPRAIAVSVLTCVCAAGCQHARSFLQMDGNSNVPFLGLQLSVDAGDSQRRNPNDRHQVVSLPDEASGLHIQPASLRGSSSQREVTKTKTRSSQTGKAKLSLTPIDLSRDTLVDAEVDSILSRWHTH